MRIPRTTLPTFYAQKPTTANAHQTKTVRHGGLPLFLWCALQDLNLRPLVPKTSALSTELKAQKLF